MSVEQHLTNQSLRFWRFRMLAAICFMVTMSQIVVEAPAYAKPVKDAPVRFAVAADVQRARVIDVESGEELRCKVQQQRDMRYVYWSRQDDGSAAREYRIELNAEPTVPPPVFVGAGDALSYGRDNSTRDLGVGLWATALPIDWNEDGVLDLLYTCKDVPQDGTYVFFQLKPNVFVKGERIGDGQSHPALADMNGDEKLDLLCGDYWFNDIRANKLSKRVDGPLTRPDFKMRYFMARQADWDGDGNNDLISAICDWREYGWDCGYDERGNWTRGPLHGPVFFNRNTGTNTEPKYEAPVPLEADDRAIDGYGSPAPCIADWDGDGDLDLVCGEFRDRLTYYENTGSARNPRLAAGTPVMAQRGIFRADLCMISPAAYDWNGDGRPDLLIGQEDGRVSVVISRGAQSGVLEVTEERFISESTGTLRCGVLVNPWRDASTGDLYCGNSAGYLVHFEWKQGTFRDGRYLKLGTQPFRLMAGYNGSIQGPAEEKWGYTTPVIGDLTNDGVPEIVYNSIIGRIDYVSFEGPNDQVGLPVTASVAWNGDPPFPSWNWWKPGATDLAVEWRTRPQIVDWDKDGKQDLVAMDHEGYLALYRGEGELLHPGQRVILGESGEPLRLNDGACGKSGRAQLHLADWDGDGDLDLIRNAKPIARWYENTGKAFSARSEFPGRALAGHDTCPNAVDWNNDGQMDLLVGAEDGAIYCFHRMALEEPDNLDAKKK
jgi:hypothetical protein